MGIDPFYMPDLLHKSRIGRLLTGINEREKGNAEAIKQGYKGGCHAEKRGRNNLEGSI